MGAAQGRARKFYLRLLPDQLKGWKPERLPKLPAPDFAYLEHEAAKDAHIGWDHWKELSEITQAEVLAHFIHSKARESYEMEAAMGDASGKKKQQKGQPMTPEEHLRAISAHMLTGQPTVLGTHKTIQLPNNPQH